MVVIFTARVFVTGVWLLIVGPNHRDPMLLLHKLTYIVWVCSPVSMSSVTCRPGPERSAAPAGAGPREPERVPAPWGAGSPLQVRPYGDARWAVVRGVASAAG